VHFVEQIQSGACVDDAGAPASFEHSANLTYFRHIVNAFGMTATSSLICDDGAKVHGRSYEDVVAIAGHADALINISGHLTQARILDRVRRKAYVDLDPGFTQFWQAQGIPGARLEGHDYYFSVGENIGRPGCDIPTCGLTWHRKPRFVVLEQWPVSASGDPHRFTTVGAWRGPFGPVEYEGRTFGLKVHEFRKFITLPTRTAQTFELALNIHPSDQADLDALHRHHWRIINPRTVAATPQTFREYVQGSGGEFSAAQGIYVSTQCGWLSDRTVRYLASGKPALVQDTGFSANYPVGEGLVAFRTLDEAVAGAEDIAHNYPRHARAARDLAETYFNSDTVLPTLFQHMDLPLGKPR